MVAAVEKCMHGARYVIKQRSGTATLGYALDIDCSEMVQKYDREAGDHTQRTVLQRCDLTAGAAQH